MCRVRRRDKVYEPYNEHLEKNSESQVEAGSGDL